MTKQEKILELKKQCEEKLNDPSAEGKIQLLIPGRAFGATKTFPGLGIRGEILCEYDDKCLCVYDVKKILNALNRLGF